MATEPKLLAEIRANTARAEKAAKHAPPTPPSGPTFVGTVESPANPNAPNNYIAQTLEECTSVAHCEDLLAHAQQHRYSEDGQTVQLIRKRIAELQSGTAKPKARKRGGAR